MKGRLLEMSIRNYSSEPRFDVVVRVSFRRERGRLDELRVSPFRRFAEERAESARVVVPLDFHRSCPDFLSRLYDIESGERS